MSKSLHSKRHKLVADAVAERRRAKGMTQAQLAKVFGRHQPFIANIESGERRIDMVELIELAEIIDLDVHSLIDRVKASDR